MLSDSKIAETFSMERTKLMYMINQGLAPFLSYLLTELNKSVICKFSFDESLNKVTQTFVSHGTHQYLLKHFSEVTKELDDSKLYQVSMGGPSVNLKFYNEVVQDGRENIVNSLIGMVS